MAARPHRSRDLSRGSERSSRALQISYIASQPIKVGEKKSGLRREQRQLLSHRKLVACLYHNGEGTIGPRLFTPPPPATNASSSAASYPRLLNICARAEAKAKCKIVAKGEKGCLFSGPFFFVPRPRDRPI